MICEPCRKERERRERTWYVPEPVPEPIPVDWPVEEPVPVEWPVEAPAETAVIYIP